MSAKLDADAWLKAMFTEDITAQFGNNPVLKGGEVLAMFKGVFANLESMVHVIDYFGQGCSQSLD